MGHILMTKRQKLLVGIALAMAIFAGSANAGDPTTGKKLVQQQCAVCHALSQSPHPSVGPSLFGVVGRRAGSLSGYSYSSAMSHADFDWTRERLSSYLAAPATVLPGNKMGFGGIKNQEKVDDIISYLETLK